MRGLRGKKEGTLIGTVDIGLTTRVIALPWTGETPSLVKEIVEGRKKLKLTQDELAQKMSVGIASIKRWKEQAFKAGGWNRLCVRPCMGKTRGMPARETEPSLSRE